MSYESIQKAQIQNVQLCSNKTEPGNNTMKKVTSHISSIFYKDKICIPTDLARSILQWYHNALNHAGRAKLKETFEIHFYTPSIMELIKEVCDTCDSCQRNKISTKH